MPKIVWDKSFSLNNEELDDQHKKWIKIINDLPEALMQTKGVGKLGETLE